MSTQVHGSTQALLDLFQFTDLPPKVRGDIQQVRDMYQQLAQWTVQFTPGGPEQTTALRKLMEAKDAAVRDIVSNQMAIERKLHGG